jgi:hypothetical protein
MFTLENHTYIPTRFEPKSVPKSDVKTSQSDQLRSGQKIDQNLAQHIFVKIKFITKTVEQSSRKRWATYLCR